MNRHAKSFVIAVGAYGEGFIRRLATVGIWDRLILARIDPSGLAVICLLLLTTLERSPYAPIAEKDVPIMRDAQGRAHARLAYLGPPSPSEQDQAARWGSRWTSRSTNSR